MRKLKCLLALLLALGMLFAAALPVAAEEEESWEDEAVEEVWEDDSAEETWEDGEEEEASYGDEEEEETGEESEAAAPVVLSDAAARVIFWICLGLAVISCTLLLTRRYVRLGWLSFALLLPIGMMFVLCKPAVTNYLLDEAGHYEYVQIFADNIFRGQKELIHQFIHYNLAYLPLTLGMTLGNLLGLNIYLSAAVCNMLCYAVMGALAVKHAPKYKLTFLAFSALPGCLFLASGFTYDGFIIACVLLGLSLMLEAWSDSHRRLSAGKAIALCLLLGAGTCAKPAYSVVLLLLWFLPADKFGSRQRRWIFRAFVVVLLIACLAGSLTGAYDGIRGGDERFDGTDSAAQLRYILANPWSFLKLLLGFEATNWTGMFFGCLSAMGYLGESAWLNFALAGLLLLVCPFDGEGNHYQHPTLTARRRILMALVGLLPMLILTITQYLVSTPVGHDGIAGVQARYFLPVWPLLALAVMMPRKLRHLLNHKWYRWLTVGVTVILLAVGFGYAGQLIFAVRG